MEYIIDEISAGQYAWLVWAFALGAVLLKPAIRILVKAWKLNKRLHIISYDDTVTYDYDEDDDD